MREPIWQDARYAARMLRRNPGFAAAAVVSLALGIGAGISVFSVADRILFRSLPYYQDNRLVSVGIIAPVFPYESLMARSIPSCAIIQLSVFTAVASWRVVDGVTDCDGGAPGPVRMRCAAVESTFLPTLGIQPLLGRSFSQTEDRPDAPKVAMLSYPPWRNYFAIAVSWGKPLRSTGVGLAAISDSLPPDLPLRSKRLAGPACVRWSDRAEMLP